MIQRTLAYCIILILFSGCSDKEKAKEQKEILPDAPTAFITKNPRVKIALFINTGKKDMFWGLFRDFMKQAVQDLEMDLKVYYANANHIQLVQIIRDAIRNDRPDVILFSNTKRKAPLIIKIANRARVPVFLVNSGINSDPAMGGPREKYKYWIGEMLPDDAGAGFRLAKMLAAKAKKDSRGRIQFLALEGTLIDPPSIQRLKGLKRAVKANPKINLNQIIAANWSPELAMRKFVYVKKARYRNLTVVWTASDGMSLGVIRGIKKLGLKPGRDILTGGVDWSEEGIQSVRRGEMTATVGGHYMEGAWCAVLIYDLFHGKDFASESVRMRSRMYVLDKSNVNRYLRKFSRKSWNKINFKKFSRKLNPGISKYDFSLDI